jgi:hydroxymethylpyrimidine pyrophosphatase-like HAD family hydrolase
MKLSVIAVDYDGTVASRDTLEPSVRDAIAAARTNGIAVLLVTGRSLDELRRVAGDLYFVDGVVAENGALVHFPESDHTTVLAPRMSAAFVAELQRRGLAIRPGECLVDANAADAPLILDALRVLEEPLVLIFNRSRVMVMSQGVSKATGLHATLDMLRLSAHNTLAIGDAENDHEMLRLAEVGAAVQWGSAALRREADMVVPGTGPAAVATFLEPYAAGRRLPVPDRARRRLKLGFTEDGREFSLAVRGRNVLITGDAKSGKSWVAGMLCEQLILFGYCVCVLDPEGDYRSLEGLPGVTVLGGEDPPPTPKELLRALRYPDRSVVIDLSRVTQDEKTAYIRAVLPALNVLRRRTGLPHRIVLDEAHYFLHDAKATHLLDLDANGYIVATYCASRLPAELIAATEVVLVTAESSGVEVDALRTRCGCGGEDGDRWRAVLGRLVRGQAVALPITEETRGRLQLFQLGRRMTPHVRHRQKYVDVPVTDQKAFVFDTTVSELRRARTLRQFVVAIETLPRASLAGYLRRGDFSRWIGEVFGDWALAEDLRRHEQRFRAGVDLDVVPEVADAVRGRYDLDPDVNTAPGAELLTRVA